MEQPRSRREGHERGEQKEPKALACYGLYTHLRGEDGTLEREVWLRFIVGSRERDHVPASIWVVLREAGGVGQTALLLVWDNAPWHTKSKVVKEWTR